MNIKNKKNTTSILLTNSLYIERMSVLGISHSIVFIQRNNRDITSLIHQVLETFQICVVVRFLKL